MDRRRFLQSGFTLAALAGLEPVSFAQRFFPDPTRLSWLAHRTAGKEGAWRLREIEGEIPEALVGTLYRVAPGQSENHGVALQHIFDGDAFAMGFSIRKGGDEQSAHVDFRARYIETPERVAETKAGRMLYSEVGTLAPAPEQGDAPLFPIPMPRGVQLKNQPSVNVHLWDGRLLGLSEGGVPTAFDPGTFAFQERWTFHHSLPLFFQGFTAHPRFDPVTGEGYACGVGYGLDLSASFVTWRMELDGTLTELHRLPLEKARMVHDMLLTDHHLIFVIPSVVVDTAAIMDGSSCITDTLKFVADEPTQLLILDRAGGGKPRRIEMPPSLGFHHGNAWEEDGKLVFDTYLAPDESLLTSIAAWAREKLPPITPPVETRVTVDLREDTLLSMDAGAPWREFPRYDLRRTGRRTRLRFTTDGIEGNEDPFATPRLSFANEATGREVIIDGGEGRMFGEPVYVPNPGSEREDAGFVLALGYDAPRDRTFLEIRAAGDGQFLARVWTPDHYPLGFHGNFTTKAFVEL